jgi:hypothetical protein
MIPTRSSIFKSNYYNHLKYSQKIQIKMKNNYVKFD